VINKIDGLIGDVFFQDDEFIALTPPPLPEYRERGILLKCFFFEKRSPLSERKPFQ
jgi:hypothetical protein